MCILTVWCPGTLVGHRLGAFIQNPEALGLDFAFAAVFTALLAGFWRDKTDLLPWCAAAVLALLTAELLPGKWYIICGGIGGALLKVWRCQRPLRTDARKDIGED
ncbi:MAG: hypothetical protein JJV98_19025 [Desulfosarcina sp.]|nr:hypothetical protein [Desulfobacterales bacterium]